MSKVKLSKASLENLKATLAAHERQLAASDFLDSLFVGLTIEEAAQAYKEATPIKLTKKERDSIIKRILQK